MLFLSGFELYSRWVSLSLVLGNETKSEEWDDYDKMKHSINYPWPVLLSVACSGAKMHYSCRDPDLINQALNKTRNAKQREVSCKNGIWPYPDKYSVYVWKRIMALFFRSKAANRDERYT